MPAIALTAKPKAKKLGAKRIRWFDHWPNQELAQQSYGRFVRPNLNTIRSIAKIYFRSPADVDDVVQNASIKIVANAYKFKEGMSEAAFVKAIAFNVAKDFGRLKKARDEHFVQAAFKGELMNRPSKIGKPEIREYDYAKMAAMVADALREIRTSFNRKEIFAYYCGLADGEVKSYKNTAEAFEIPLGTVKSVIRGMRQELRKKIGPMFDIQDRKRPSARKKAK